MRTIVFLFIIALATQAPAPLDKSAAVEGRVTLYGTSDPIPKVQITIYSAVSGSTFQSSTVTDASGHFIVTGVPAGTYIIVGQRGGYASPTRNGERIAGGSQRTITVAAQQNEVADLSLVRGGVISGRVLDAGGRPIPRLQVEARSAGADGTSIAERTAKSAETNDRGEYRLFDLDPGRYVVSAEYRQTAGAVVSSSQNSWVKTYFPGVTTTANAGSIDVGEGSVVPAADFTIQNSSATFKLSGVVTTPGVDSSRLSLQAIYLVPVDADESARERQFPVNVRNMSPQATSRGNMRFEIPAASGSYELFVLVVDSNDIRTDFAGRMLVQVNHDVKDITVAAGGTYVKGQVVITGDIKSPIDALRVILRPVDLPAVLGRSVSQRPAVFESDGFFTIANIAKGKWQLFISNVPSSLAIADIRQGNTTISPNNVAVGDSAAEAIRIVLSAAGSIEGFVRDSNQKPLAAVRVISLPYNQPPIEGTETLTDSAGHFLLKGLPSGDHALYTFASDFLPEIPANATIDQKIRTVLTPYQVQAMIAHVSSGASATVALTPLKPLTNQDRFLH